MKTFDIINKETIKEAELGDLFEGYGLLANGAHITYKSIEKDEQGCDVVFAYFREITKKGKPSKYTFTYLHDVKGSELSDSHRS